MALTFVVSVFFIAYNKGVKEGTKMFGNNYNSPYGATPGVTPAQSYGYPSSPYTNLIYVSGIEAAKNAYVPAGGTMIFADNDKPLLYKKTVDNKGQFEVEVFDIVPHKSVEAPVVDYVPRTEFEALQKKIDSIESAVAHHLMPTEVKPNGTVE